MTLIYSILFRNPGLEMSVEGRRSVNYGLVDLGTKICRDCFVITKAEKLGCARDNFELIVDRMQKISVAHAWPFGLDYL